MLDEDKYPNLEKLHFRFMETDYDSADDLVLFLYNECPRDSKKVIIKFSGVKLDWKVQL